MSCRWATSGLRFQILQPSRWIMKIDADFAKIEEIARRVVSSEGLELVEVELKGSVSNYLLRIFIDKPEGVNHGDCRLVSEQVGAILEVEGSLPGRYTLEVSSPGLDRPLKKLEDYQRYTGRRAKIVLREPLDGQRNFEGRLQGVEGGRVRLETTDKNKKVFDLEHTSIAKAKLVVEF